MVVFPSHDSVVTVFDCVPPPQDLEQLLQLVSVILGPLQHFSLLVVVLQTRPVNLSLNVLVVFAVPTPSGTLQVPATIVLVVESHSL